RIYGYTEFWGLPFKINEHTLDPRPDTELIIELALQRFDQNRDLRILDLGLGSGCILISLLKEFPNALGFGVDVSAQACKTSRENARLNNCEDRIHISCGSWADALKAQNNHQKFDLIVSNPPYIANQVVPTLSQEVQNHDPILSLDGGDDGLDAYKIIFSQIGTLFTEGGIGLFEIGYDQSEDVSRLSKTAGFLLRAVHHDYVRNPRVVEISCGDK
ncbi:MAG: peptide chain release factor N(5)-glutamine methyltransferase, partial [Alcanivorax sp.]